jgi:S1-C subfamily serine protease
MERPKSVAAAEVRAAITNIAPANVPLDEKREKRMAWMGVMLQKMTTELARANRCSEQTAEGKNGALITLVYPDSPAAKAGIEAGMILLRLDVEGEPKPMTINAEMDEYRSSPFPWEQLDRVPAEYLDRMPSPWPPVDNSFSRLLASIGFGTRYVAQFFHKGQEFSREFVVVESPPHFDSAARHKSEQLGLTVRDLTFEVRQYMQKKPDDPGVIISKVETGGKAAVAGIKPFEVITHVNGNPVANVNDFTRLAGEGGELNLSVNRMADSRQVRVKADKKSP